MLIWELNLDWHCHCSFTPDELVHLLLLSRLEDRESIKWKQFTGHQMSFSKWFYLAQNGEEEQEEETLQNMFLENCVLSIWSLILNILKEYYPS